MIRLKDIAESAGVSVMTVSKALRDEPDISKTTKARIKGIADQVGYVPNNSARGLRTKITKQFGLIIYPLSNPVYTRTFMAIEERAHEMGNEKRPALGVYSPDKSTDYLSAPSIGLILSLPFMTNSGSSKRPPLYLAIERCFAAIFQMWKRTTSPRRK